MCARVDIHQNQKKAGVFLCLKLFSYFKWSGHCIMCTELLSCSLYDFLKANDHRGFPLKCVIKIMWQVFTALGAAWWLFCLSAFLLFCFSAFLLFCISAFLLFTA